MGHPVISFKGLRTSGLLVASPSGCRAAASEWGHLPPAVPALARQGHFQVQSFGPNNGMSLVGHPVIELIKKARFSEFSRPEIDLILE